MLWLLIVICSVSFHLLNYRLKETIQNHARINAFESSYKNSTSNTSTGNNFKTTFHLQKKLFFFFFLQKLARYTWDVCSILVKIFHEYFLIFQIFLINIFIQIKRICRRYFGVVFWNKIFYYMRFCDVFRSYEVTWSHLNFKFQIWKRNWTAFATQAFFTCITLSFFYHQRLQ